MLICSFMADSRMMARSASRSWRTTATGATNSANLRRLRVLTGDSLTARTYLDPLPEVLVGLRRTLHRLQSA
jgi:hypothetical protein